MRYASLPRLTWDWFGVLDSSWFGGSGCWWCPDCKTPWKNAGFEVERASRDYPGSSGPVCPGCGKANVYYSEIRRFKVTSRYTLHILSSQETKNAA